MIGKGFVFIRSYRAFPSRTRRLSPVPDQISAFDVSLRSVTLAEFIKCTHSEQRTCMRRRGVFA
jgi:hypothetical protein